MMSLTLARGYIKRLLENNRVPRHLREHHSDLLTEFEAIAAAERCEGGKIKAVPKSPETCSWLW